MRTLEEKLGEFEYDDLGEGRYAIRELKNKLAEHIEVPEGVVEIKKCAFADCAMLRSVELPDSLLIIRRSAFLNCVALEEIILPDSVKVLENQAFAKCSKLKKVRLSEGLTELQSWVFNGASFLTQINVPFSVQKICSCAFDGTGVRRIEIPTSVVCLERRAFYGNIKEVHYLGSREDWKKIEKESYSTLDLKVTYAKGEAKQAASQKTEATAKAKKSAASDSKKTHELAIRIKACELAIQEQERVVRRFEDKQRERERQKQSLKKRSFIIIGLPLIVGLACILLGGKNDAILFVGKACLIWGTVCGILFLLTSFLGADFKRKKKEELQEEQAENQDISDVMEVLHEMLRIARDEGKLVEKKNAERPVMCLSFYNEAEKRCETCAHFGERVNQTIRKTTDEYGRIVNESVVEQEHIKFFCNKFEKVEVFKESCCDHHCFVRVAKALSKAEEILSHTEELVKAGFR